MMGKGVLYKMSNQSYTDLTTGISTGMQGCDEASNSQVGSAQNMMGDMMLWHGTLASGVVLTPPGWVSSAAAGCSGDTQVGNGMPGFMGFGHPFLTHGTKESFVDLTPPGSTSAGVASCEGDTQVGSVLWPLFMQGHACLWKGTAESCVDLNPFDAPASSAVACSGNLQVGNYVASDGFGHAVVWSGSAASAIDLHQFAVQSNPTYVATEATGVDASTGDISGIAYTLNGPFLIPHAVLWKVAVASETLAPQAEAVKIGKPSFGSVTDMSAEDGLAREICKFVQPNATSPVVRALYTYVTSKTAPSAIEYDVVAKMSAGGQFKVRLSLSNQPDLGLAANPATDFDEVLTQTPIGTTYQTFVGNASGSLSTYVGVGGAMTTMIEVYRTGFSAVAAPCVDLDAAVLKVSG